ncbi:MAG: menaquinone biosynthesis protein [Rikenellaceae bacterium]
MVSRKTIAAVSYLNTIPFIYGISHGDQNLCAEFLLSPPSGCTSAFSSNQCDIALVPVAAIPTLNNKRILSRFCIGASGKVRSVALLSNTPLDKISKIYLDPHSQSSVLLVRILASKHWNIEPTWLPITDFETINPSDKESAWVLIGDKVFDYEDKFEYNYDLAHQWQQMTGLPFTFAVWVANKDVDQQYTHLLEQSLEYGIGNIPAALACSRFADKQYALDYLSNNIDYIFDEQKKAAMELFWEEGMRIKPLINPG